jgi:hypothetical protein
MLLLIGWNTHHDVLNCLACHFVRAALRGPCTPASVRLEKHSFSRAAPKRRLASHSIPLCHHFLSTETLLPSPASVSQSQHCSHTEHRSFANTSPQKKQNNKTAHGITATVSARTKTNRSLVPLRCADKYSSSHGNAPATAPAPQQAADILRALHITVQATNVNRLSFFLTPDI